MSIPRLITGAVFAMAAVGDDPAAGAASAALETQPPVASIHSIEVQGIKLFYREAGDPRAPAILLLHGFATSSFMYRNLIPLLADRYHVIAPDLPGFGFTEVPDSAHYRYSFDN